VLEIEELQDNQENKTKRGEMNKLKLFSLATGLSAIIVIVYFLLVNPGRAIYLTEAIWWIRIPEIIIGFIAIPILISMIKEEINNGT